MYRSSPFSLFPCFLSFRVTQTPIIFSPQPPPWQQITHVIPFFGSQINRQDVVHAESSFFLFFSRHQLPPRSEIIDPLSESLAHGATMEAFQFFHIITSGKQAFWK
jgi:hypothetical protein